ncbi:hypothetical protein HZY83_03280 [Gemella sp. GH3]|nr:MULTISPECIES: hypothetical protein [unclassified Gemella]MBF0713703.1 hypothetical protein [Gemella sp. GH3.1]NYS50655.1 hypothetical protein [Gemella sp. GH3]
MEDNVENIANQAKDKFASVVSNDQVDGVKDNIKDKLSKTIESFSKK